MKKFMLALSAIIMIFFATTITPSNVSASTDKEQIISICNYLNNNPLEEVDSNNASTYRQTVTDGLVLAEQINADSTRKAKIENFEFKFNYIFNSYKFFLIDYEIESIYNPSEYSQSENGVVKLNNAKHTAINGVEYATSKSEADEAFNDFKNLVNSNELVKNVNIAQTESDAKITGAIETVDGSKIFSPDDSVVISKYVNSIIIKNAKVALLNNAELASENYGIAYYFNVEYKQNGIFSEKDFKSAVKVKIKLSDVGLDLQNGTVVQIAKYQGNHNITLNDASVEEGYLVFTLKSPGEYALVADGYAIKNRSYVVQFFIDYGVYVLLGVVVILIIAIPIRVRRKAKRKAEKRIKKEFKIFRKSNKIKEKQNKKKRG